MIQRNPFETTKANKFTVAVGEEKLTQKTKRE